ncbi:bifunctional AP-4-A phosphorylase/ADP sulfurylase PWA37_002849 [Arxiozyma heterogenica]|uniref:Uncharacterized protein n=1 Tax=Arxiozyma heterogenica TaxID=278026 RepID=A0AAN7WLM9_9SACH|nr:hypothetical protein RI543_004434 [Kazachstania heterogenica]
MIDSNISELIHQKYENAIANGSLKLTKSSSKKLKDSLTGMPYLVHFAPVLAEKPKSNGEQSDNKEDPFENPDEDLLITPDLNGDGAYKLLLNKYPIVPEHTLLVTNNYQHQSSALTPQDLMIAYKYLCKMDDEDENIRHLVFYNSGPQSGSSQNHKHLQSFRIPSNFKMFQDKLCSGKEHFLPNIKDEPLQDDKVAFAHFVLPLPEDCNSVDEDLLAMCYFSLLQRTLTFFQDWLNETPNMVRSYNVLLTKNWICLVPRSHAKTTDVKHEPKAKDNDNDDKKTNDNNDDDNDDDDDSMNVDLSINATGYAGMVLVKDQESYDKILANPDLIDKSLFECGFPNTSGKRPTEYHY